jgi:hypothetical protein
MMANKIEFAPAIPMPFVRDVQERIQQLRNYLDPNHPQYEREEQHVNIKAAIKLYEDGKIDGLQHVYIMEGKIVTRKEVFKKGMVWAWFEVYSFKFLASIRNSSNEWTQITGDASSVCSKVCLRSWAFWS